MLRYLAGLATGTAATTAGLWLLVAPFALGHAHPRIGRPAAIDLMAGAVITTLGLLTVAAWTTAWRDRLRADGVLRRRPPPRPRRQRPARTRGQQGDHATAPGAAPGGTRSAAAPSGPTTEDLRELLAPLVAALTAQQPTVPAPGPRPEFRYEPPAARHPDVHGHDTRSHQAHSADAHGTDARRPDARRPDARGTDARGTDTRGADARGADAGSGDARSSELHSPEPHSPDVRQSARGERPDARPRSHGDITATRPRTCPPHPRGTDDPEEAW